jgi:hypothetical protein
VKNQFWGIFFYLLYLLAMMRPLLPIIEYYANYDYIATVLCENKDKPYLECNGKCYLQKQLQKTNHTNHDHKSTVPKINLDDYPVSPLDNYTFNPNVNNSINQEKIDFDTNFSNEFFNTVFKPPKIIL